MAVFTATIVLSAYYANLALIFKLHQRNVNFALINLMVVNFVVLILSVLNVKMDTFWIFLQTNVENVQRLFLVVFHVPITLTAHYANNRLIFPQPLINAKAVRRIFLVV